MSNIDFYQELMSRIQGLKTAKVAICGDKCVVDELLRDQGLTQTTATQTQRDEAAIRAEEQATVMFYLRNINQSWHGSMVRYLEDTYATGSDIIRPRFRTPTISWMIRRHGTVFKGSLLVGLMELQ